MGLKLPWEIVNKIYAAASRPTFTSTRFLNCFSRALPNWSKHAPATGDGLPVMDRPGGAAKDETVFPAFRLSCLLPEQPSTTEMFQVYGIPDRQVVCLFSFCPPFLLIFRVGYFAQPFAILKQRGHTPFLNIYMSYNVHIHYMYLLCLQCFMSLPVWGLGVGSLKSLCSFNMRNFNK